MPSAVVVNAATSSPGAVGHRHHGTVHGMAVGAGHRDDDATGRIATAQRDAEIGDSGPVGEIVVEGRRCRRPIRRDSEPSIGGSPAAAGRGSAGAAAPARRHLDDRRIAAGCGATVRRSRRTAPSTPAHRRSNRDPDAMSSECGRRRRRSACPPSVGAGSGHLGGAAGCDRTRTGRRPRSGFSRSCRVRRRPTRRGSRDCRYRPAKTSDIRSASSWSCTVFDPVAGLPDSTRATCWMS